MHNIMAEMQSWRPRSPNLRSQIRIIVPLSLCSLNSLSLDKTNMLELGNCISRSNYIFVEAFTVF